jgi:hypothetical protein
VYKSIVTAGEEDFPIMNEQEDLENSIKAALDKTVEAAKSLHLSTNEILQRLQNRFDVVDKAPNAPMNSTIKKKFDPLAGP